MISKDHLEPVQAHELKPKGQNMFDIFEKEKKR